MEGYVLYDGICDSTVKRDVRRILPEEFAYNLAR